MAKELMLKLIRNKRNGQTTVMLPKKIIGEKLLKRKFLKFTLGDS